MGARSWVKVLPFCFFVFTSSAPIVCQSCFWELIDWLQVRLFGLSFFWLDFQSFSKDWDNN
tara:strand:- start:639 stop:821 length:183 start_codon:yes stop_codon:yes gene_type:complete